MPVGAGRLGFWFINGSSPGPDTPLEQFPNAGFEQGTTGWTVASSRIRMGGLSVLAGCPTPTDPLLRPYGSPGDASTVSRMPSFSYTLETVDKPPLGEVQSMRLSMGSTTTGIVSPTGSLLYGPAIYSNFYVTFNAGDSCAFDWKALPGSDAYNVYAYMVEQNNCNYVTLLRSAGANRFAGTTWSTTTVVVPTAGAYKFVFVAGSWDSTYGGVIGGEMLIDNIRRIQP